VCVRDILRATGRWIFRIDEQIIPAGCSNGSIGDIVVSPTYGPMQGGILVNGRPVWGMQVHTRANSERTVSACQ
jgi:hypothetical protein